MATTFTASTVTPTGGLPNRNNVKKHAAIFAEQISWSWQSYTWAAAGVIDDVYEIVTVPKGAKVCDALMEVPDMDTSTGLVLNLGYGGAAASSTKGYWVASSTVGQAGGVARKAAVGSVPVILSTTADDTIDIHIGTAATGTALATGTMYAAGLIQPAFAIDALNAGNSH